MSTVNLTVIDGLGAQKNVAAEQANSGTLTPHQVPEVAGAAVSNANPLPVAIIGTPTDTITAAAGARSTVTVGGTAVVAITGESMTTGGKIVNPIGAAYSLFVDPVNAAGVVAPGTHGTTEEIPPGHTWTAPGPLTNDVSVNCQAEQSFTVIIF